MPLPDRLESVRIEVACLEPAERVRLRSWLGAHFDGCGNIRERQGELQRHLYQLTEFVRDDLRVSYRARHLQDLAWYQPGIYGIASESDWLYVGRTVKLSVRRTNHACTLRFGKHPNRLLQSHWDRTAEPMWFVILESTPSEVDFRHQVRRGVEHPRELVWKQRLRPLYDLEARKLDVSFLLHPKVGLRHQPVNASPSSTWPGGPPTFPRSTSKACGLPS
jgi:hypothetical protein